MSVLLMLLAGNGIIKSVSGPLSLAADSVVPRKHCFA